MEKIGFRYDGDGGKVLSYCNRAIRMELMIR